MENFLASRPSISKLGVQPKATANLFASLANRTAARPVATASADKPVTPVAAETAAAPHLHEAQVELIRENGAVQRIVVVCKCGERIALDCVY